MRIGNGIVRMRIGNGIVRMRIGNGIVRMRIGNGIVGSIHCFHQTPRNVVKGLKGEKCQETINLFSNICSLFV